MAEIVTKIYECDRCGKQSTSSSFNTGNSEGSTKLKYSGSRGAMSYQGDWGGCNHSGEKLLCDDCTDGFLKWLNKPTEVGNND